MDGHQGFRCSLFSQSDQKRFMEKFPRGNHRQEMRFICNQDVFVLIEHLLPKGYGFFILQLAVIENASANSKGSLCIDAASGFIHHLTLRHPCLPSRGMHVRILSLKKSMTVFHGPAGSHWQLGPTPATKGSGAFKLTSLFVMSLVNNGAAFLMTLR